MKKNIIILGAALLVAFGTILGINKYNSACSCGETCSEVCATNCTCE